MVWGVSRNIEEGRLLQSSSTGLRTKTTNIILAIIGTPNIFMQVNYLFGFLSMSWGQNLTENQRLGEKNAP